MLYVAIGSADLELPEQFLLMQRRLGVANYHELANNVWPEIDAFKLEFPGNKIQISACTQFKNDLAQLLYDSEPEKQFQVKEEVIAESIFLADKSPESPGFI
jgi:hypothetical protein